MSHITVAADSSQTLRRTVHSRSDYTPVQQLQIQMIQNRIILQQLHYFQTGHLDLSKSKLTVSFDCIIQKNTSNRSLHSNNWICSFLDIVHLQLYYDGRLDPSWRGGRLSCHFSVTIFAQPVLCCRGCVPLPFSLKYYKGVLLDSHQKEHFNRLHFSFYSFRQTLM